MTTTVTTRFLRPVRDWPLYSAANRQTNILRQYQENAFQLSALPSAEAVVVQDDKILLVQRRDDKLWAFPGGITDPGETLATSAQRELWEEAGISGQVRQLLGIFDSRLWHSNKKIHFYHAVFLIDSVTSSTQPRSRSFRSPLTLPRMSCRHSRLVIICACPLFSNSFVGKRPSPFLILQSDRKSKVAICKDRRKLIIDGNTKLIGLIGWPVSHSFSPAMHNAAAAALGLNWIYIPLPVRPQNLQSAVQGLAALGFNGVNVTVPA